MLSLRSRQAGAFCLQLNRYVSNQMRNAAKPNVRQTHLIQSQGQQSIIGRRSLSNQIVEGSDATYKPSPFQKKVLVWTKVYATEKEVPDRIRRAQMKKAMDKFRMKASIYMVGMTLVFAAIMAFIGRKSRLEGISLGRQVLEKREKMRAEHLEQQGK